MPQEFSNNQQNRREVTQLRPIADDLVVHVDLAFKTLEPIKVDLFQLRKCGVRVEMPEPVRQQMMAQYGDAASDLLAKLDGRVWI